MTRARFLLVSLFAGIASALAGTKTDQEAAARNWLEQNGFGIRDESMEIGGVKYVLRRIWFVETGKGWSIRLYKPGQKFDACIKFANWIKQRGFKLTEHYVDCGENLEDIELAPPRTFYFNPVGAPV